MGTSALPSDLVGPPPHHSQPTPQSAAETPWNNAAPGPHFWDGTVAGHLLNVYVDFPSLLPDVLRDLTAATRRIWIEMYMFSNDAAGQAVAAVLKQQAQAGLDVRLLYDAIGSQNTPASFFADLQAAGVQVHCYHTFTEALFHLRFFTMMNRRDHRKLIVLDDAIGYFGGMNIIDCTQTPYPSTRRSRHPLPPSAGWRDVHLRMVGPQQSELAESFERSWMRAHRQKISRRPRAYRRARLPNGAAGDAASESIKFFDSGPGLKYSRAARVFNRLLNRAQHDVAISMAYFVPVGRVLRALLAARRRGVRFRIVMPGRSDVPLVQHATTHLYSLLIKRGFHLYERQSQMLHSKVMVIDQTWTVVGSCNFDPRSLWINLEFLAVIRSPTLAAVMRHICRNEMEQSQRVTEALCHLPWHQRLLNTLAWAVRWWL